MFKLHTKNQIIVFWLDCHNKLIVLGVCLMQVEVFVQKLIGFPSQRLETGQSLLTFY
jgi:hypothetical protein